MKRTCGNCQNRVWLDEEEPYSAYYDICRQYDEAKTEEEYETAMECGNYAEGMPDCLKETYEPLKIIISGPDSVQNAHIVTNTIDSLITDMETAACINSVRNMQLLIRANPKGVDEIAEQYARQNNMTVRYFETYWHGRKGDHNRNCMMAEAAKTNGVLLVFCDSKDKDQRIRDMIDEASNRGIETKITHINN